MKYLYFCMVIMALAACTPVPVYHVTQVAVPEALLSCQEAPTVPLNPSARELATFIVDDREAGADCRAKLRAIKTFQLEVAKGIN